MKAPVAPKIDRGMYMQLVSSNQAKDVETELRSIFDESFLLKILCTFYYNEDKALIEILGEAIVKRDLYGIKNALRLGADLSKHSKEMIVLAGGNKDIKNLLEEQIKANALLCSAIEETIDAIRIIKAIKYGAQVSVKIYTTDGEYHYWIHRLSSCLSKSSTTDIINALELLVNAGADVRTKNSRGTEAIHVTNHLAITKYLISQKASVLAKNILGIEPIHYAAKKHDRFPILKYLIDQKASVSAQDSLGWTPLRYAIEGGCLPIIQYLIAINADPRTQYLDCNGIQHQSIHLAAGHGKTDIVKYLASIGVDLFTQSGTGIAAGSTVVHFAAGSGHVDTLKYCLASGFKVSDINKDNAQPLHFAALSGGFNAVKYLVENQADILAQTKGGNTPIDIACMAKTPNDAVKAFLLEELLKRVPIKNIVMLDSQLHADQHVADQSQSLDIEVIGNVEEDG